MNKSDDEMRPAKAPREELRFVRADDWAARKVEQLKRQALLGLMAHFKSLMRERP